MGEWTGIVIVRNKICRNAGRVLWHPAFFLHKIPFYMIVIGR